MLRMCIFVARVLMCSVFLATGVSRLVCWRDWADGILTIVTYWDHWFVSHGFSPRILANIDRNCMVASIVIGILELLGSMLVLSGSMVKTGIFCLLLPSSIFLLGSDISFWGGKQEHFSTTLTNISLIGSMICLLMQSSGTKTKSGGKNVLTQTDIAG